MTSLKTQRFKVVILGDANVGKSSIILRYGLGRFDAWHEPTLGAAFHRKRVELSDGTSLDLEIWDTAGQEKFNSLTSLYCKGAQAALVVYDITKGESYEGAKKWKNRVLLENECTAEDIAIALVGNKSDLEEARKVDSKEAESYASACGLVFSETSALENSNIRYIFEQIAEKLSFMSMKPQYNRGASVDSVLLEGEQFDERQNNMVIAQNPPCCL